MILPSMTNQFPAKVGPLITQFFQHLGDSERITPVTLFPDKEAQK